MLNIKNCMLKVFQDPNYSELHPETRHNFEASIIAMEELEKVLPAYINSHNTLILYLNKSQKSRSIGGLVTGRWLTCEASIFQEPANG